MSPLSRHRDGRVRTSKHTRKVRRANTNLSRQLRRMSKAGKDAYATLLTVLAQSGSEITVTQGTIDQVREHFNDLSFTVEAKKDVPNEYVVKMVIEYYRETPDTPDTPDDRPASGTSDAEGAADVEAA